MELEAGEVVNPEAGEMLNIQAGNMMSSEAGEITNPEASEAMNTEENEMVLDKTGSAGCQSKKNTPFSLTFFIFFMILSFFRQSYLDA